MPWGALGDMGALRAQSMFFAPPMPSQMPPPSMLLPPASPFYYGPPYGAPPMMAGTMAGFGPGGLGLLPFPPPLPHSFHLTPSSLPLKRLTKDELFREQKRAANRKSAHVSREKRRLFVDEVAVASRSLKWRKRILDMLPDLVISVNRHGRITFASKSVLERLRVSPRVVGTSVFEIVAPAARGAAAALLQQSTTLLGEGPHYAEMYLITTGGSTLR
jgi:PAS domain-containing protein